MMLKAAEIERLPAKVIREITSPAHGLVLIDCRLARAEDDEEPPPISLHWRTGDWSKPPLDIALDEDTGRFQSLQLALQDETIERKMLSDVEPATLASETGIPVFERTLWSDDDRYVDENLQTIPSWEGQSNLLVVFGSSPVQITRACLVDASLTFLFNEQDEVTGFWLNQVTQEEKRIIHFATLLK